MAKIFQEGDLVTKEWLNKVSKTVTDACGDQVTATNLRIHIGAETAGAAGDVQAELNAHKADTDIHFTNTDLANTYIAKTEKATASGVAPLNANAKVPAEFLPASGGYDGIYLSQALMVADGAGHLQGQRFLVTQDNDTSLNGEYTATIDAPTSIALYFFNSGDVAVHGHAASEVTNSAGGNVQNFIDANPQAILDNFENRVIGYELNGIHKIRGNSLLNLLRTNEKSTVRNTSYPWPVTSMTEGVLTVAASGDSGIRQDLVGIAGLGWQEHWARVYFAGAWGDWKNITSGDYIKFDDTISQLGETTVQGAINALSAGASEGNLKSDFSVQMVGTPSLQQDIATKGSTVDISGDTMTGPLVLSGDATNSLGAATKQQVEEDFKSRYFGFSTTGTHGISNGDLNGIVTNGRTGINSNFNLPGAWEPGATGVLDVINLGGVVLQTAREIRVDGTAFTGNVFTRGTTSGPTGWSYWETTSRHLTLTQAEYDALGAWDDNTIYNITSKTISND